MYLDNRSIFFEHKIVTLHDQRPRVILMSRQHAIGGSIEDLLHGLVGSNKIADCPDEIKIWLQAMTISSQNLRKIK